jgi:hypothetical protein
VKNPVMTSTKPLYGVSADCFTLVTMRETMKQQYGLIRRSWVSWRFLDLREIENELLA